MCEHRLSCLAGLSPALDPIVRRRCSLIGHVARIPEDTPALQPCGATSICHSVSFQIPFGGDVQASLGTGGLTNSTGTTVHLLLTWRRAATRGHSGDDAI